MNVEIPEKLAPLFKPMRFKVLRGGRAGSKSWTVARALLVLGAQRKLRILCTRETQNSITESVHFLLSSQIEQMGLQNFYTVQNTTIFGKNGTEFIFAGLKQNILNLKSYEGVDICWVEEAQTVSNRSWTILIPTIRKAAPGGPFEQGAEIWVTFNPDLETDDTYKRFILHPPDNCWSVEINYYDNPYCPTVLLPEIEKCRVTDFEEYEHIWLGKCRTRVQGAIYEKEMKALDEAGRICSVPYDRSRPVNTYWDIGDRFTDIWFIQYVGFQFRVIDFRGWEHISTPDCIKELQSLPYVYGTDFLPWDAKSPNRGGSGKSFEEQVRAMGRRATAIGRTSREAGISAVRTILPQCWFDAETCADGINSLRRYRWSPDGGQGLLKQTPFHDEHSHPADAFRVFGVSAQRIAQDTEVSEQRRQQPWTMHEYGPHSWMG